MNEFKWHCEQFLATSRQHLLAGDWRGSQPPRAESDDGASGFSALTHHRTHPEQ